MLLILPLTFLATFTLITEHPAWLHIARNTFIVLAAFVVATGKWANPLTLPAKTLLFLLLSGLATGASWVCYFRALKIGDASKVAPVDKLSLVLVAVFAVLFLHERPAAREWVGILMVAAGVLVLAWKR
jgi:transporter family protein